MAVSEIEGKLYLTNLRIQRFVGRQLATKAQLKAQLESEDIDPLMEMRAKEAIRIINYNIQKFRADGLLEQRL